MPLAALLHCSSMVEALWISLVSLDVGFARICYALRGHIVWKY